MTNLLKNARNGAFDHTTMLAVEDQDEDEVALTPVAGIVENFKPELMEPMRSLGRMSLLDGGPASVRESDYVLNIAGVHEDALTRDWGAGVAAQASQFVRDCPVRSTWWEIGGLRDPRVLEDAVHAAAAADMLIVSVRAAHELPFGLCAWICAWLPRRLPLPGSLVALIGAPEQPGGKASCRLPRYLQAAARSGQLGFLLREQELPLETADLSLKDTAERTFVQTPLFSEKTDVRHWGINE